jgi:hypothetical protein
VSGRNFFRLMESGEVGLLFPGGVREAYKRKGEKYALFWPSQEEFVRLASRFGATIVPFAAVGAEDSVDILLDSEELKKLPFLGDRVRSGQGSMPKARRGAAADNYVKEFGEEDFIAPLIAPRGLPDRYYFVFQRPITLTGSETREECQAIYEHVKGEVEGGIRYLCAKREEDPFRDPRTRLPHEAAALFKRQAPTFQL